MNKELQSQRMMLSPFVKMEPSGVFCQEVYTRSLNTEPEPRRDNDPGFFAEKKPGYLKKPGFWQVATPKRELRNDEREQTLQG
jgi:hypothetical protein